MDEAMKKLTLIYNARFIDESVDLHKGALLIKNGKIERFLQQRELQKFLRYGGSGDGIQLYDAQGLTVMPAFIDMHAHFRDPGLTQKENLASGSKAAAAGGFGTLVLMPNTKPVISSQEAALANDKKGKEIGLAHLIQSVSITENFDGQTIAHLNDLDRKIVPLITEDGHEVQDSAVMFEAMKIAAKKKIIVSCHCEDPFLAAAARPLRKAALEKIEQGNKKEAVKLLRQADELLRLAEDTATDRNIALASMAGCHLHLCHVSTKHCIEAVARAKRAGQDISAEVTPHHIGLTGGTAPGIFNIVNPPLRSEEDRHALIEALIDGTADCIATDHAPHTAGDKRSGSPGFSGLESAFAVCYTNLVLDSGMDLQKLSSCMSATPARLLGLKDRGLLKTGCHADLAVVDTEKRWTVKGENFKSKGHYTPWEGKKLTGKVEAVFFNGQMTQAECQ